MATPGLAEFLKGTVDDTLTKILKPAGVIPGGLFVLLNLAFVVPRLNDAEVGLAQAYTGLEEGWQAVTVAALVLVVGYLLMGASGAILDTLCGRTWRASLLARALVWWRGKRQERLKARTKRSEGEDLEPIEHLKWRLRTRFPQAGTCTPTALGDVLLAYDQSVQERFGMRLAALWEPLRAVVASEDAAVKAAADEKSGVDLSANLAFAGALFIFEALVVFGLLGDWDAMLIAVAGLPVIYLAYRVTVTRALSWCDAIDTVVLLHRKALLEKAGLRTPATAAKQRDALRRLGGFLLRDGKADDLFDAPAAAAAPAVTSSKNVRVVVEHHEEREPPDPDTPEALHRGTVRHVLLATRRGGDDGLRVAGHLAVSDARVPRIREAPSRLRGCGPDPAALRRHDPVGAAVAGARRVARPLLRARPMAGRGCGNGRLRHGGAGRRRPTTRPSCSSAASTRR